MIKLVYKYAGNIDSHSCRTILEIRLPNGYEQSLNFVHVLSHYTAQFDTYEVILNYINTKCWWTLIFPYE